MKQLPWVLVALLLSAWFVGGVRQVRERRCAMKSVVAAAPAPEALAEPDPVAARKETTAPAAVRIVPRRSRRLLQQPADMIMRSGDGSGLQNSTFTLDLGPLSSGYERDMEYLVITAENSLKAIETRFSSFVIVLKSGEAAEVQTKVYEVVKPPTLDTLRVDVVAKTVGEAISQLRAAGVRIEIEGELDESAAISIDLRGGLARGALDWLASAAGIVVRIEDGVAHLSPK